MTTVTAPLASLALAAFAPDVVRSCIVLQPSPPPDPGEEPPAPVGDDDIYTPVAPGVTYAALPTAPTIVDTSPDQMIGCIITVADNPQGRLNALFPSAISGDGVIDRATNDIWVYDGATWNNVGPTPGPTIVATVVIPPWNEIVSADAITRTKLDITSLGYALTLLTEPDPVITQTTLLARNVPAYVAVPSVTFSLAAFSPVIPALVKPPAALIGIQPFIPAIYTGASIPVPSLGSTLQATAPDEVGRAKTSVNTPSTNIALSAHEVAVSTGVAISVSSIDTGITSYTPLAYGQPKVIGSFINSDSTADTSHILTAPTHASGDTLIAALMWRSDKGTLTAPSGWSLYGTYMSSIVFSGNQQNILVYTKTAGASEPVSYTWTAANSTRNCGLIASVRNGSIYEVVENYGNGTTATVATVENVLNITVFTWIFAAISGTESYSQTISAGSITEITDSPNAQARISGGYSLSAGTVTSTHAATATTDNPNHGGICIRIR